MGHQFSIFLRVGIYLYGKHQPAIITTVYCDDKNNHIWVNFAYIQVIIKPSAADQHTIMGISQVVLSGVDVGYLQNLCHQKLQLIITKKKNYSQMAESSLLNQPNFLCFAQFWLFSSMLVFLAGAVPPTASTRQTGPK